MIVGTVVQGFWGDYPGLSARLTHLTQLLDRLAGESQKRYGRRLDLAVLPETAVTSGAGRDGEAGALPYQGEVQRTFSRKAQELGCYIVVPLYLLEGRKVSNAAVLIDRKGEVAGIYRKVHVAVHTGADSMEAGTTPGTEVPVFACDFGKLGIQICFDMEYDYGWRELARKGADLVAWPTASPQTAHPAFRAMRHRYYIVSSPWRHNASIFEPTGKITAQVNLREQTLVRELDLSYAILPWSERLENGNALRKKYGRKVGFRYYEEEDSGIFWSNDPRLTIGKMIRSLGLAEAESELERIRLLYRKAGVPSY
ncbi:MAG: carbon-nitrogen hydrolase family protein [Acidobacteriota bacterium]